MTVESPLQAGGQFRVTFDGKLRESRGGYFWLRTPAGVAVALLRSDGNPEVAMDYSLDVTHATMLADALAGPTSRLVLPPDIPPGTYLFCTALGNEECVEVVLRAP